MIGRLKINWDGLEAAVNTPEVKRLVDDVAERVAENIRGMGIRVDGIPGHYELPVKVKPSDSDRPRAEVLLAHPAGRAVQAKHGALTRAAAQAGLEVKGG